MIILGIDPGVAATGFGIIEVREDESVAAIKSGVITPGAKTPHDKRLRHIFDAVSGLIASFKPDAVAVESIFHSKSLKALADVSEAIGVITLAAGNYNLEIKKFTPLEVKYAVTGFGKAGKEQVKHMVRNILGLDLGGSNHHASDALAVAICYKNLFC